MKNELKIIFCTAIFYLTGCAAPLPQHSLPDNLPAAYLISGIQGADMRNESIDIYIRDQRAPVVKEKKLFGLSMRDSRLPGPEESRLFTIHKSVATPSGYIRVPAGEQFLIRYFEIANGGRFCSITGNPILEPGKKYRLVGGFEYEKGPIPIITDTRKCSFGILDESTKLSVPLEPGAKAPSVPAKSFLISQ